MEIPFQTYRLQLEAAVIVVNAPSGTHAEWAVCWEHFGEFPHCWTGRTLLRQSWSREGENLWHAGTPWREIRTTGHQAWWTTSTDGAGRSGKSSNEQLNPPGRRGPLLYPKKRLAIFIIFSSIYFWSSGVFFAATIEPQLLLPARGGLTQQLPHHQPFYYCTVS